MRCTIGLHKLQFLFCCPVFEVSCIVHFFVPRDFLATVSALARTSETLGYAGSFPFNVLRTWLASYLQPQFGEMQGACYLFTRRIYRESHPGFRSLRKLLRQQVIRTISKLLCCILLVRFEVQARTDRYFGSVWRSVWRGTLLKQRSPM